MERRAAIGDYRLEPRVLEACRQGDREAFRELFENYRDRVYSIAYHFFHGDDGSANDVTQQVFLKLMDKVGQFRRDAEFSTWLYRLVVNACLDEQRKRRRFLLFGDAVQVNSGSVSASQERDLLDGERANTVKEAVASLKPQLRLTVLLKYYDGLSYEEIGAALGCSSGTVASRLNRAHKLLARRLSPLREIGGEP